MERFLALFKRFKNKKNEELYPICIDQIAELYKSDPQKFNFILFHKIKDFMMSSSTNYRLLGSALFQKIIEKLQNAKDFSKYLMPREELQFDVKDFINELSKNRRKKKRAKKLDEYKKILLIDLINFSQEEVRVHLSKRDNFLYSKCGKTLEQREKKYKRNSD